MAPQYWLFKSEPEVYSFADLTRDGRTNWDHVRNFQARNFLKQVRKGDQAFIYHSNDDKAVVGIATCVREGYPDIDADDGKEWVQIDLAPVKPLKNPVTLATLKATPALKDLLLIRQSRLSCLPVTPAEFQAILKLSEHTPSAPVKKPSPKKTAPQKLSTGKAAKKLSPAKTPSSKKTKNKAVKK